MRAFDHLTPLFWRRYDRARTGMLIDRVTGHREEIGESAHYGREDALIALMIFVGAFGLMLWINPQRALVMPTIVRAILVLRPYVGAGFRRPPGGDPGWSARDAGHRRRGYVGHPLDAGRARYRGPTLRACEVMPVRSTLQIMGPQLVTVILVDAGFVLTGDLTAGGFVGLLLIGGASHRPREGTDVTVRAGETVALVGPSLTAVGFWGARSGRLF
ncbi:MAG: hypothetical protein ACK41Y_00545 [Paracoccus hibiscisoli]|uniref:hypothetical protein n=1 Tax=Paracoccus hibiscisoli TaxID=2023261 RepID=UPI00391CC8AA